LINTSNKQLVYGVLYKHQRNWFVLAAPSRIVRMAKYKESIKTRFFI